MAIRIPSTPMKKSVKAARRNAAQAIKMGVAAVAKAKREAKANPTAKNKSRVKRFERTLAKAKAVDAELARSERIANSMCPLQIMFIEFEYV